MGRGDCMAKLISKCSASFKFAPSTTKSFPSFGFSETFASLEEVKDFVVGEIRREFYAEGHMFYTYKRLGINRMLWGATEVGEEQYILPLPDSEFDPAV